MLSPDIIQSCSMDKYIVNDFAIFGRSTVVLRSDTIIKSNNGETIKGHVLKLTLSVTC